MKSPSILVKFNVKPHKNAKRVLLYFQLMENKIHTKPHPGLEWRIFHILASEDINDFTDVEFVS